MGELKGINMAAKRKPKPEPVKPRNQITLKAFPDEDRDDVIARELTHPAVQSATTIQRMQGDNHEVNALARELQKQVDAVNAGNLTRAEGMLIAQAHTLDEIFNSLARRAHLNMGEYINAAETYMRLALKAQSQCRATLETLAAIKNPPIVYAKQANISNGPQQVNNGILAPSHEGEKLIEQTKLSGGGNELCQNTGAPALTGSVDKEVEAVGAIHGAKVGSG